MKKIKFKKNQKKFFKGEGERGGGGITGAKLSPGHPGTHMGSFWVGCT